MPISVETAGSTDSWIRTANGSILGALQNFTQKFCNAFGSNCVYSCGPGCNCRRSGERLLALEHLLQALVHDGDGAKIGKLDPVAMDLGIGLGFVAHRW